MTKQIETFLRNREFRRGFTLMELLIVLAILVVLMAILLPVVFRRFQDQRVRQAEIVVKKLTEALEEYNINTGTYPTMDQGGLDALITRPSMPATTTNPQQGPAQGQPQNMMNSPTGNSTNPNDMMFQQPGQNGQNGMMQNTQNQGNNMIMQPQNTGGFQAPQGMQGTMGGGMTGDMTGGMGNMGGGMSGDMTGGMGGMQGGMGGMTDMSGGMGGMQGGMGGMTDMSGGMGGMQGGMGGMTGAPNNVSAAQQEYRAKLAISKWRRCWEDPVIAADPWGQPYFYEYPTQRTFGGTPAVWSAGPDKVSDTEDDIRNYIPEDVEMRRAQQAQNTPQGQQFGAQSGGANQMGGGNMNMMGGGANQMGGGDMNMMGGGANQMGGGNMNMMGGGANQMGGGNMNTMGGGANQMGGGNMNMMGGGN